MSQRHVPSCVLVIFGTCITNPCNIWPCDILQGQILQEFATCYDMLHEAQRVEFRATCRRDKTASKVVLRMPKIISTHEGRCRCYMSLEHVPATFSCVCTHCDFVAATWFVLFMGQHFFNRVNINQPRH